MTFDHCGALRVNRFFNACRFLITDSAAYCWACYGNNAQILDATIRLPNKPREFKCTAQIILDTVTHTVYEISVADFRWNKGKGRGFKWYNPDYSLIHDVEAARRGVEHADQAWDNVNYKRTREAAVLRHIKSLFGPAPRKKKKASAPRKLAKALKRKQIVR
jgi:hypothetical protein